MYEHMMSLQVYLRKRAQLRSRREERRGKGVKNLKGAKGFPKSFYNHGKKMLTILTSEYINLKI